MLRFMPLLMPLVGCTFDEGIVITDIEGTVILPREATEATFVHPDDGTEVDVEGDIRLLGPVYLGLYPSVSQTLLSYPHPEMGPIIEADVPGDTYPYGGSSVGDIRFACVEYLTCRVASGRFEDYDSIIEWFADVVGAPVTDASGLEVTSGAWLQAECFDLLNVVSDAEVRITAYEDRNDDGNIDAQDLDFVERSDGNFEAAFKIWQQEYYEGFSLWGFMDGPSAVSSKFTTCNALEGFNVNEYNADFNAGSPYADILNFPSLYIDAGDYVASEGHVFSSADENPELWIDFPVEQ
jgi:hypothetical protein